MAWKLSPIFKYTVRGNSMEPTFFEGDSVIVNRLAYLFKKPNKNDVIILKYPKNKKREIMKRIQRVTHKSYFLVGDNVIQSTDSRHFGLVQKESIIGKVTEN